MAARTGDALDAAAAPAAADGGSAAPGTAPDAAAAGPPTIVGSLAWAAANKERRLPPHKHNKEYDDNLRAGPFFPPSHWTCCDCMDKTSTYCCALTSSTNFWFKNEYTYNGHGDERDPDSYISIW